MSGGDRFTEIRNLRQAPGEPRRRWFQSCAFELIVFFAESGEPVEFQLCYNHDTAERALVWRSGEAVRAMIVDSGETRPGSHKGSPIYLADGAADLPAVGAAFAAESATLPPELAALVLDQLQDRHTG